MDKKLIVDLISALLHYIHVVLVDIRILVFFVKCCFIVEMLICDNGYLILHYHVFLFPGTKNKTSGHGIKTSSSLSVMKCALAYNFDELIR